MKSERWQLIEELYHSASDLPDGQRNSFLQEACGEDQSLLYEVESLLRHGSRSQSVLDTPAMAIMAKAMAADESKSSAPFLPGTTVSHYRILEPIGRGGGEWCIKQRISSCGVWLLSSCCRSSWLRTHKLCTGSSAKLRQLPHSIIPTSVRFTRSTKLRVCTSSPSNYSKEKPFPRVFSSQNPRKIREPDLLRSARPEPANFLCPQSSVSI